MEYFNSFWPNPNFGNPNPKYFLYKEGKGSFPKVDVSLFPSSFSKGRAPLLVRLVAIFSLFHFFEREDTCFMWSLNFMRRRAPFCNLGPTEGIEIFLEPTNEFAFGFSTPRVIGRYFSCYFVILSYFFLFMLWNRKPNSKQKPYSNLTRIQFLLSFMKACCLITWTYSWMSISVAVIWNLFKLKFEVPPSST